METARSPRWSACSLPPPIYLMLSRHIIRMLLGIALFGNAVNLLIFTAGRIASTTAADRSRPACSGRPPVTANPLPQALILTAIVISFSFFAFLLVLAYRAYQDARHRRHRGMRLPSPRTRRAAAADGVLSDGRRPTADLAAAIVTAPTALSRLAGRSRRWSCRSLAGALLLMLRATTCVCTPAIALTGLAVLVLLEPLLLARVIADGPLVMTMGRWLPPFGICLRRRSSLGALFVLGRSLVGAGRALYSLRDDRPAAAATASIRS